MQVKKAIPPLDRFTYGRSPGAVYLVDLLNEEIAKKTPNIGRIVRKVGSYIGNSQTTLRELEKAAERGILSLETTSYLLTLHRKAVLASIGRDGVTGVREDLAAYDARLYNLLTNVITADIKSFMRRLQAWSVAKARQSSLKSRMAKGELDDQDEPIYDPTGAVLWDAGELIELTLRDFYSDKDLKIDELWQKARSVKL